MHGHAMDLDPVHVHEALAALAAPSRFELLVLMLPGVDRSVSQLAQAVGLSQSCTTRHLQALSRAGLVKGVRDGKRVVFRIAPRDAAARAVLASVSGATPRKPTGASRSADRHRSSASRGTTPATPGERKRPQRPEPRRRAPTGDATIPPEVLAAMRIESAAELEPYGAGHADAGGDPLPGAQPSPESGRTSEPEALPAWRRSDLDDFLL